MKAKLLFFVIFVFFLLLINRVKIPVCGNSNLPAFKEEAISGELPFKKGEKIIFDFFLFGIKSGRSNIEFLGDANLGNKKLFLISSATDALKYKGTEKIFVEWDSFLPVRVERDLKIGWDSENIVEEYNVEDGSVVIKKKKNGKVLKDIIFKNEGSYQHVISLLYYLRTIDLSLGQIIPVKLPKLSLELKVKSIEKIRVPFATKNAFFISDPKENLRIWLSIDEKLPLQFSYSSTAKRYSMKMRTLVR